ncbi:unnamed protein product [Blepharisma stoltei]|uniref:Uncharacterized protein n=1 Tax=Blepharisma stoltei TaxID=1481888 RepID=A0AAU9JE47_9CILI|nr:unnamed protein product [Blepharisma stoltei]
MENYTPIGPYKSAYLRRIDLSLKEKPTEHSRQVSFSKIFKDLFEDQGSSIKNLHKKPDLPRHQSVPKYATVKDLSSSFRIRDSPREGKKNPKAFSPSKLELEANKSLILSSSYTKVSFGKKTPMFPNERKESPISLSTKRIKLLKLELFQDSNNQNSKSFIKESYNMNTPKYHIKLPRLIGISPRFKLRNL